MVVLGGAGELSELWPTGGGGLTVFFAVNDNVPPFEMSSCEWPIQDTNPSFPSSP